MKTKKKYRSCYKDKDHTNISVTRNETENDSIVQLQEKLEQDSYYEN